MTFDLAAARNRVGLAPDDLSQDALLQATLAASLSTVEMFLDRRLMAEDQIETFYAPRGDLQLIRYPVISVTSVVYETSEPVDPSHYRVEKPGGRILFRQRQAGPDIEVSYRGGYETLPPDLEQALWLVFDATWAISSDPGGSTAPLESVTIPDVGTLRYGDGGNVSGWPVDGVAGAPIGSVAGLLMPYRRISA